MSLSMLLGASGRHGVGRIALRTLQAQYSTYLISCSDLTTERTMLDRNSPSFTALSIDVLLAIFLEVAVPDILSLKQVRRAPMRIVCPDRSVSFADPLSCRHVVSCTPWGHPITCGIKSQNTPRFL